jgi:hypothetical protein
MKTVNPRVLFLCSMIDFGNNRLEKLAFDKCDSIDLTFDYFQAPHRLLLKRFSSDVIPRIISDLKTLTVNLCHIPYRQNLLEMNSEGINRNLIHWKIMLGTKHDQTGIPYTIGK